MKKNSTESEDSCMKNNIATDRGDPILQVPKSSIMTKNIFSISNNNTN